MTRGDLGVTAGVRRRGTILAAAALVATIATACAGDSDGISADSGPGGVATGAPGREAPPSPAATGTTLGGDGAPAIHFTDLESGPGTGGEDGAGVFVAVTGRGFGGEQGVSTVTIGGGEVHAYPEWSDTEVVVQIGERARTGDVVVHTSTGDSNGVPFTVRVGGIFFVAPRGDGDGTADGSREHPWVSVADAVDAMHPGDTTYLLDGVEVVDEDAFDASLSIETSGEPGQPKALVSYPGARATIGGDALEFGTRVPNLGVGSTDWVFSHLVLRGRVSALDIGGSGSNRWRVVGNDISCPGGDGQTGCFAVSLAEGVAFLGNEVHDVGRDRSPAPSKQYHSVYFTTDTNHVDVGWNHLHDNRTCRGIQFHSSPLDDAGETGFSQHDLWVHDNLIEGSICDALDFATVDPSLGPVRAVGNVIRHAGAGPPPPDGDANYACVHVATITNSGPDGSGVVEISGNVLEDCGARGGGDAGAVSRGQGSPGLRVRLEGNTIRQQPGERYLSESTPTGYLDDAGGNTWEGAGPPPFP